MYQLGFVKFDDRKFFIPNNNAEDILANLSGGLGFVVNYTLLPSVFKTWVNIGFWFLNNYLPHPSLQLKLDLDNSKIDSIFNPREGW